MKGKNKLLFGFLFLFGILASMNLVIGATGTVSIDLPANSATLTDSFVFNITNSSFDAMVNCTMSIASSLTANTSVTIGTFDNDTLINVNGTYDSNFIEDANDYTLTASCRNSSNDDATTTATTLIIQNTVPTAPSSLSPADKNVDSDGDITFSGTVAGADTTSCTLQFTGNIPPGGNAQSMTHSGDTCSLTLSSVPDQTYTWFIRASDETDTADSSSIQVTSDVQTSAGKTAALIASGKVKSQGGATFTVIPGIGDVTTNQIIGGLVVVGILIFFLKKKKR